jgi:3-deoxy-alpha-D-manno-octulosonate 8-oxidase
MKNSTLVHKYILGKESLSQLNTVLNPKRVSNKSFAVFCIDHFFEDRNFVENLPVQDNDLILFIDTTDEPKADYVDSLVKKIQSLKDTLPCCIVGIGGGSSLDISKMISILLTNPGKAQDYQGWDLVKEKAVFKIGIPTIAGTGAEFTRTAVVTSKIKKLGINSDQSVFDQVILDPNLLKTVPKEQFFYTAMDCFVHNVESLRGSQNDELTIAFAEKSLEMMREVFFNEMNYEKLMVASVMGGISIANSNVGICHPLSYGLSLVLGLHHGFAICIAFNQLEEYYPEVKEFKQFLKKSEIKLPKIIDENVTHEQINMMADATLKNEKPLENAFGLNWKDIFTKDKVIQLIEKM